MGSGLLSTVLGRAEEATVLIAEGEGLDCVRGGKERVSLEIGASLCSGDLLGDGTIYLLEGESGIEWLGEEGWIVNSKI